MEADEVQLWFPVCRECGLVTKFVGPKNLDPSEIRCRKCGAVCEDANVLIDRGDLSVKIPEEAVEEFIVATDTMFRNPDGSWV